MKLKLWLIAITLTLGIGLPIPVENKGYFWPMLLPELIPVCTCESGGKHFTESGEVIRGRVNKNDIGLCQINLDYHQLKAEKLGLDLFKENDNIIYANHLFTEQGYEPWSASKSCWQNM